MTKTTFEITFPFLPHLAKRNEVAIKQLPLLVESYHQLSCGDVDRRESLDVKI